MSVNKNQESSSVVGEVEVSDEILSFSGRNNIEPNKVIITQARRTSFIVKNKNIQATPIVRALASKMGIEISKILGTGPSGRILRKDVKLANSMKNEISPTEIISKILPSDVGMKQSLPKNIFTAITPLAAAKAKAHNVDLSKVTGTGYNNKIMEKDIDNVISSSPSFSGNKASQIQKKISSKFTEESTKHGQDKREKISGIRKAIAKTMKNSWNSVAYTNLVTEVNVTNLWNMRTKIKDKILNSTNVKLTFLPFFVKAIALALKDFPILNSTYDEKTSEIVLKGNINVGIAVDTATGLMVPVIKNANQKSIIAIASETSKLANAARSKKLTMKEMSGGTFSITNYGSVGALFGVPVIKYPELAISGIGAIVDRVYVGPDGTFYAGKVVNITTAADHRWIDGADIGRFNLKIKELLENPEMIGIL